MFYARHYMQVLSHHVTIWFGKRYGHHFPMYFVCGFPRSGTTWVSEILADYLNLPRPRHYIFPIGFASVIHTHASAKSGLTNCFYVVRDGRDAMVSLYFSTMNHMRREQYPAKRRFTKLFGVNFDPNDVQNNLPLFLEDQFVRPSGASQHWGEHTLMWLDRAQNTPNEVVLTRYEILLQNTTQEFNRVLAAMFDTVDDDLLLEAVNRQSFKRQLRRPQEQHQTFLRQGQAGDWKSHFSQESAEIFDHYAGKALVELGYENDHRWLSEFVV